MPVKVTFSAVGGCGHDFNLSVWDTVLEFALAALEPPPREDREGARMARHTEMRCALASLKTASEVCSCCSTSTNKALESFRAGHEVR